jgi:Pyruvate/2-oxoacid:ferredoxin oxidoreductase delta subunit
VVSSFHREREAVYELPDAQQRDAAFQRLAHRTFDSLGLAELFTARLSEFPQVPAHVELVVVRRVWNKKEEQVELYVSLPAAPKAGAPSAAQAGRPGDAQPTLHVSTTLFIGLQAIRCLDREKLAAFLRHELIHVADMLDPAFAYDPHPVFGGECEPEHELIRGRFRALWDLWVHARIRRRGWQTLLDDDARQREVIRAFALLSPSVQEELITAVSRQSRWTQGELLELARGTASGRGMTFDEGRRNGVIDRRTFLTSAPRHLLEGVRALMTDLKGLSPPVLGGQAHSLSRRVAMLDVSRCLAWGGGSCQVCYLRCPLREHALVLEDGKPTVVASACDGCGICVEACDAVNDLRAMVLASV